MRPFSNGSEFDYWTARNCSKDTGCIHDSVWGDERTGPDNWCPLITAAYDGSWPKEWPVVGDIFVGECTKFEVAP